MTLSHHSRRMPGLLLALTAALSVGTVLGAAAPFEFGLRAAGGAAVPALLAGLGLFTVLTHHQEAYCAQGACHQDVCHQPDLLDEEAPDDH